MLQIYTSNIKPINKNTLTSNNTNKILIANNNSNSGIKNIKTNINSNISNINTNFTSVYYNSGNDSDRSGGSSRPRKLLYF